jgi:hypothetical protein
VTLLQSCKTSVALYDSTLLAELNCYDNILYLNVSSVNATLRGKGGGGVMKTWSIMGESVLRRPRGIIS